ncbi:MAG: hypothetical protein ABIT71_20475 [Vicinamibacteraceae bacterium]
MGVMSGSLKLGNVWKVISEFDLNTIRQEALAAFDLAILGDPRQAERMRAALSPGGAASPHRFVRVNPPGGGATIPNAVIVVAPPGPRSSDLDTTLRYLVDHRIPHALALVDDTVSIEEAAAQAAATLVDAIPDGERLAFAHQLPPFRRPLFERIIEDTARANASFAFTSGLAEVVPILTAPLNLGDMIVLTKNQLLMGYRLVLASGRDGEPKRLIGELLGVLGGGLLFRQMARQLVGLIPVVGILPKVAVAYGGTWAIGRAVVLWATEGRTASSETLRAFSREGLERGRAVAREISARGKAGVARASGRWDRLRAHVPGLRRRARGETQAAGTTPPALPPPLPPPTPG